MVLFVGHRHRPSWCLATRINPGIPPALAAAAIWLASKRGRVELRRLLVAKAPFPVGIGINAEMNKGIELEFMPANHGSRGGCRPALGAMPCGRTHRALPAQ